jgi:ornithine--oxo-acid transaminase
VQPTSNPAAIEERDGTNHEDPGLLESEYAAPNYAPIPITIRHAEGAWIEDVHGRRYLDLISAYSAHNFGHRHPRLIQAAHRQLDSLTLTSRAVRNDQLGPFCRDLADLTGMESVLPMNSGAEGVETAIKTARRWGYRVKGIPKDRARIIVCEDNFHGRTTTIVGFSTDPDARADFGPFTPGFAAVPFGDARALEAAIDESTVAVLFEPIQGEAGVVVPPDGYLKAVRDICTRSGVLMIADEIQSGFGRTGRTFACDHEDVRPDVYILGKALGGGIMPLSAVVSTRDIMGVFEPGSHGSTFGGNPLACAIGREVIAMIRTGEFQERAATLGTRMLDALRAGSGRGIGDVRGRGLWAGLDLEEGMPPGKKISLTLADRGLLVKETHGTRLRLAPPLVIEQGDLDRAIEQVLDVCAELKDRD